MLVCAMHIAYACCSQCFHAQCTSEVIKAPFFVAAPPVELFSSRGLRRGHAHQARQPHHAAVHETAHDRHVPPQETEGETTRVRFPNMTFFCFVLVSGSTEAALILHAYFL